MSSTAGGAKPGAQPVSQQDGGYNSPRHTNDDVAHSAIVNGLLSNDSSGPEPVFHDHEEDLMDAILGEDF